MFRRVADFREDDSLAMRLRLKTIAIFKELIRPLPKPLRIVDAGGTELFWERMGFSGDEDMDIVLLNLAEEKTHYQNIKSIAGDARNMHQFRDGEFDIAFSHSVIEHVGEYHDQIQMANEFRRVGKRYFLQTPNFYFPFEPHFFFPFFQFFPLWLKVFMIRRFNLGYHNKITDKEEAIKTINSIRLLKKKELKELFPDAIIIDNKLFGLTQSYVVHNMQIRARRDV